MTAAMASAAATSTTTTLPTSSSSSPPSSSMLPSVPENACLVRVAFDYEYDYKTRKIAVKQGEKLHLLQKTNQHWWKCMRPGVNKAFFVPAQYVIVVDGERGDDDDDAGEDSRKPGTEKRSTSSVDSGSTSGGERVPKPRKSIFSTFERLKESRASPTKPAVPSKNNKPSICRNEGVRASHRVVTTKEKSQNNHHNQYHPPHDRKAGSGSSLRLKNWSASLEELSKQIVFPGLTSESVVDLTSLSATHSYKPISSNHVGNSPLASPSSPLPSTKSKKTMGANESSKSSNTCGTQGSGGGGSSSSEEKFHAINKCLSFRNPNFANNNNEEKGCRTNEQNAGSGGGSRERTQSLSSQVDSPEMNKTDSHNHQNQMKSKDSSDGSLDSGGSRETIPVPKGPPLRLLSDNWAEYFSPQKGRYFYYNAEEKKTSWKPPRSSSNRRSDECLASGRSMSTFGSSSIEDSLDNLYEEVNDSMDVNSISCSSGSNVNINIASSGGLHLPLPKPDILQIPSSVTSSRKSVAISMEELHNSPDKSHNNNDNSHGGDTHGSCSSVFDSQENLDRSPTHHQDHLVDDEASCSTEFSLANLTASIPIPEGWEECWEESLQQLYYVNKVTGAKWFTSTDPQGKIYFYEENSSQSSWFLPEVKVSSSGGSAQKESTEQTKAINSISNSQSNSEEVLSYGTVKKRHSAGDAIDRGAKSKSMFLPDYRPGDSFRNNSLPRQKVSIWCGGHANSIIREGPLGRTKITEGGKKVRKNWGVVYAVLTKSHLSLFKDQKSFTAHKSELEVELNGSTVEWTEEKSSRKNVFQLNSRTDLQLLFQSEDKNIAIEWFEDIKGISESYLPVDISMRLRSTECPETLLDPPIGERKISSRIYRNKSTKIKITPADDMGPDGKKITANLKKFFSRRPPWESLVKKGIYKDEPVFGCSLEKLCLLEKRTVPLFVEECILAIEQKEENLKTDGIYRASGNLSQVQKIRLQVDQNNFQCLYQEEDVHVLAGSLKLFFREMREPLISYDLFEKSFEAINSNKKEKVSKFRDIVKNLAKPNRDTLQALLRHLLKIADYAEFNRMMIPNLAIVFGPTLMWPAMESKNMALDLMQQNYVIEALLVDFVSIFQ